MDVEVLENLVEKSTALHGHRSRLLDQPRVVVVPVKARTLQVIVQRGRAEVPDLDGRGVAIATVGFVGLTRIAIGEEREVEAERDHPAGAAVSQPVSVGRNQDLCLAGEQDVPGQQPTGGPSQLSRFGLGRRQAEKHRRAGLAQIRVGVGDIGATLRSGHRHEREACLLREVAVGVRGPRRHEADLEALQPGAVVRFEQRMRAGGHREEAVGEA